MITMPRTVTIPGTAIIVTAAITAVTTITHLLLSFILKGLRGVGFKGFLATEVRHSQTFHVSMPCIMSNLNSCFFLQRTTMTSPALTSQVGEAP